MLESIIKDAEGLFKAQKELERENKTLTFGSKKEWKRYNSGLISLEEFNKIKNTQPMLFVGRANETMGNRKIKLSGNKIIFKQSRNNHHVLNLFTSKNRFRILEKLQTVKIPITYRLGQNHIWISFDESVLNESKHTFVENRIGSLDLNPNYIAFTIQDFQKDESKIVHRSIFNLTELNKTFNKNKKDHEVIEISKTISNLCKQYKVEIVGMEKLDMVSKDHKKGKYLNRLINNSWNRNCFSNNLKKRLNILGIKNQEIMAAYSSTVGCLQSPDETDSIAAALEMGRRTYVFLNRFLNKKEEFSDRDILYPILDYKKIKERWNSILSDYNPKRVGWKSIHEYLKKQKKSNELRFLFKDYDFSSWSCFRHKTYKSLVSTYQKV